MKAKLKDLLAVCPGSCVIPPSLELKYVIHYDEMQVTAIPSLKVRVLAANWTKIDKNHRLSTVAVTRSKMLI